MTTLGDILSGAVSAIRAIEGEPTVEYRSGNSGAWTTLAGAVVHKRDAVEEYDETRARYYISRTGTVITPESSASLSRGYQVRIGSSDADIWRVSDVRSSVGSKQYAINRRETVESGPDRGGDS